MNKRKTTSIALAAAVAISTVQLAYPANVFANDIVQNEETKVEEKINLSEKENTSNEDWSNCEQCSKEKPHIISTVDDLDKIRTHTKKVDEKTSIDGYFKLANNITFTESDFAEGGKFYNDGWGWTPIGHSNEAKYNFGKQFIGELDGNNFTISGVKINRPEGYWYNGLIAGPAGNAYIHDLTLDKFDLEANGTGVLFGQSFGDNVVVERINVKNSKVKGKTTENKYSRILAGGVIGTRISDINIENSSYNYGSSSKKSSYIVAELTDSTLEKVNVKKCNLTSYVGSGILLGVISKNVKIQDVNIEESKFTPKHETWNYLIGEEYHTEGTERILSDINIDIDVVKDSVLNKDGHTTVPKVGSKITEANNVNINLSYEDGGEVNLINQKNIIYFKKNRMDKESGYAKINEQQIGAYLNGGNLPKDTIFEYDKLVSPIRDGHAFLGWYDNENCAGDATENFSLNNTYYSKWLKVADEYYNIKYGDALKISNENIKGYKVDDKYKNIIDIDDNGNVTTKGIGDAEIEYKVVVDGKEQTVKSKVKVEKPNDTVAMIGNVPYSSLNKAINSINNNKDVVNIVLEKDKCIEIKTPINIVGKNNIAIDFNGSTLKSSSNNDYVINVKNSNNIFFKDSKFDLSGNEDTAILVDGKDNSGTSISLVGDNLEVNKKSIIKIEGKNAKVELEKGSTINGSKTPEVGKGDVIIDNSSGATSSEFINRNNSSSGGSVPSIPSKPTYTHEKIEGLDRYETAAKIADKLESYDNVVLVNAESSMSDGLSASGLAGKENGAILLTKKDSIPKATMDRIKKVKKVYIIGGENAISKKVSDEITKNVPNVKVERLGGKTRIETSELVAKKLGNYNKAFVVNGFKGEADAMSASSVAAKNGAPILLTNGKTSTHAKKSGVEYYVIGGNTVVDKSIADKYNAEVLAGKDRYATNKEVINEFYSGRDKIYFANGETLVDALTASTLAKKDGIALVNAKSDKSVLKGKNTVQVGGMKFTIDFEK